MQQDDLPPSDSELTQRQREIIKLICADLTSREIAKRMNLSPKTVTFHRQKIKHRLGVRGTAGIVRYAVRNGIIDA